MSLKYKSCAKLKLVKSYCVIVLKIRSQYVAVVGPLLYGSPGTLALIVPSFVAAYINGSRQKTANSYIREPDSQVHMLQNI